jgi:very-short-patch-repair endonuclease
MRNSAITGPDNAIAEIAGEQWAVITWAQLLQAGLSRPAVTRRVRSGRLHRLHRGVYSLVPRTALAPEGLWLAGVLACGIGAALSHRSAGMLWDVLERDCSFVEVTAPIGRAQHVAGVRLHRSRTLSEHVVIRRGIPVTTLERTLADLADVVSPAQLRRAAQQAEFLRSKIGPAGDPWRHANGRRGAPTLRTLPLLRARAGMTWSELEYRMLRICRQAGLPAPECNRRIAGYRVDFVWRSERLIVETDGGQAHLTATAFEEDRRRDVELMLAGWRVARFTWAAIVREPTMVANRLARLLDGPVSS